MAASCTARGCELSTGGVLSGCLSDTGAVLSAAELSPPDDDSPPPQAVSTQTESEHTVMSESIFLSFILFPFLQNQPLLAEGLR